MTKYCSHVGNVSSLSTDNNPSLEDLITVFHCEVDYRTSTLYFLFVCSVLCNLYPVIGFQYIGLVHWHPSDSSAAALLYF